MKQQIRETIKNNLQKLSKEELVNTLTDIFMSCSAINMIDAVSSIQCVQRINDQFASIQCVTPSISPYTQQINDQFASIQQPINRLEK